MDSIANNQQALATIILGTAVAVAVNMIWKRALGRSVAAPFKPKKAMSTKDSLILTMLEDVMDGDARPCYVVTDPALPDNPIVYASEGFCSFTKYTKAEIEGRNCRFLQGPNTDKSDVKKIRDAINEKKDVSVQLLNYKKDGTTFINQFFLCPLFNDAGEVVYFLGVQKQIDTRAEKQDGKNPGWRIFMWL